MILEKIRYYSHQKVPTYLIKEYRKLGNEKYWSLNSNEFCDFISLHQTLQKQGFELSETVQQILNSESLQFQILEQQINQVGKTIMLLGDGYFPSIVSIHRHTIESPKADIRQAFDLDFSQMRVEQKVETTEVSDLDSALDEIFYWSYNYVKFFAKDKSFFKEDHWNAQILEIINTCKMNLLVYANNWKPVITKYFLQQADGTEIILLELDNGDSKSTLRIQNVVH